MTDVLGTLVDVAIVIMASVFVAVSVAMTLVPDRLAEYVRRNRSWRDYLRSAYGIEENNITAERLNLRAQGAIGLVFSLFLCMALWQRFVG
jgi:hypothetical protein